MSEETTSSKLSNSDSLKRPLLPATPNASNNVHPPKRFRPSPALNKPFRSPLITKPSSSCAAPITPARDHTVETPVSRKAPPETSERHNQPPRTPMKSTDQPIQSVNTPYRPSTSYKKQFSTPTPSAPLFSKPSSILTPKRTPSSDSTDAPLGLDVNALQRKHASLQQQLRTERARLDTLQQTLRIEISSEEIRLDSLIEKWKLAGRQAAELMFGIAKDRVGRNGGIFEQKKNSGFEQNYGWDEGDGMDEEKRKQLLEESGYLDENNTLEDDDGEKDEEEEEEEEEPEEFTMGKMLKIMGIGKEMLGWDSERNAWE